MGRLAFFILVYIVFGAATFLGVSMLEGLKDGLSKHQRSDSMISHEKYRLFDSTAAVVLGWPAVWAMIGINLAGAFGYKLKMWIYKKVIKWKS